MREFETDRLRLRKFRETDAEAMFRNWASNPNVAKYVKWYAHENIEATKGYLGYILSQHEKPDTYIWGIERKSDGELIGSIDVVGYIDGFPELGYCSGESFWGNGYMTEACKAVIKELFTDGYNTIYIKAIKENIGSNRVIEKSGFKFVEMKDEPVSDCKPQIVSMNYYRIDK